MLTETPSAQQKILRNNKSTTQQYFSLTTNQPPITTQQYFSLTNQHQPPALTLIRPNN
jgi:hypothetical protein